MRKAVAILGVTGALTFGGAGVAHATMYESPVPATTTTLAGRHRGRQRQHRTVGARRPTRSARPAGPEAAQRAARLRRGRSGRTARLRQYAAGLVTSAQLRPATCSTGWRADLIWSVQTPLSCPSQEPKHRTRMSSVLRYPTVE